MPKRPSPSQPEPPQTTWTIYKFASRLQWLGTVQATHKREAIEKAAKEFRLDPTQLMAEPRGDDQDDSLPPSQPGIPSATFPLCRSFG